MPCLSGIAADLEVPVLSLVKPEAALYNYGTKVTYGLLPDRLKYNERVEGNASQRAISDPYGEVEL